MLNGWDKHRVSELDFWICNIVSFWTRGRQSPRACENDAVHLHATLKLGERGARQKNEPKHTFSPHRRPLQFHAILIPSTDGAFKNTRKTNDVTTTDDRRRQRQRTTTNDHRSFTAINIHEKMKFSREGEGEHSSGEDRSAAPQSRFHCPSQASWGPELPRNRPVNCRLNCHWQFRRARLALLF